MGSRNAWTSAPGSSSLNYTASGSRSIQGVSGTLGRGYRFGPWSGRGDGARSTVEVSILPNCQTAVVRPGRSNDQRALKVEWFLEANVLDPRSDVFVQGIDAKAVLFGVDDREKPFAEEDPFGRADQALEDGILNPLPKIFTGLRCVPEATAPCGACRGDIVGDQVEHDWRSIIEDYSG
jgi:hypothetical protein